MKARTLRYLLSAVLCAALLLPGCVVIDPADPPSWLPRALIPTVTPSPAATAHPAPSEKKRADVWKAYFVRSGRLVAAQRPGRPADVSPLKMVETLIAGPSAAERTSGLRSALPPSTKVLAAGRDYQGNVYLDLSPAFATGGSEASMRPRVAQLVWTLTQIPGVKGVLIKIGGRPVERFGKERLDLIRPQRQADYADLLGS